MLGVRLHIILSVLRSFLTLGKRFVGADLYFGVSYTGISVKVRISWWILQSHFRSSKLGPELLGRVLVNTLVDARLDGKGPLNARKLY